MKSLLSALPFLTLAWPAHAHIDNVPHLHEGDAAAVLVGAALCVLAGGLAAIRARSKGGRK